MIKEAFENLELKDRFDSEIEPDPGRIVHGLRDTGYDFNTAIADIIDNSITAEATKVDVTISLDPTSNLTVYIADNGKGMDRKELRNAMRYGSDAHANVKSLSKFGLGLKTASTAFCRCLSLVSRDKFGSVHKIQWDIDYISELGKWKPKTPDPTAEEIRILDRIAENGSGTLVIWEKVDRLLNKDIDDYASKQTLSTAIKNKTIKLQKHIGLTFQRFLDEDDARCSNVQISLNMNPITAIDPFCIKEKDTMKFETDKPLKIKIGGHVHSVVLRAYVLPRPDDFSTKEAREIASINNNTEGFYIYREDRLIHYGDWLTMFSNEPHYSLLRVEFSFGAELDSAFNVDIKKSRILPADNIIKYIQDTFIAAPRREANDRYRLGKSKKVNEKASSYDAHASSNRSIDEKAESAEESKFDIDDSGKATLTNANGTFLSKIEILSDQNNGQIRIVTVDDLENGTLWKPCIVDGKHAIKLNQNHPYYQKVYYPVLEQKVMVTGMDSLLWALAEAENSTVNPEVEEYYEDMRIAVSRILKKIIVDLPEPTIEI